MNAAMARTSRSSFNDDVDVLDSPSEIEIGTLAISANENMKVKEEIWKRPPRRPSFTKNKLRFQIQFANVMPPETENVNIKRYVIYDLTVRKDLCYRNPDPNPVTIGRRYTDFFNLYNGLKKDHPESLNNNCIYFPRKVLMGNFSSDLIAERSTAFEALLAHIIGSSILKESKYFLYFLQDIELTQACKYLDERRNELAVPILENCFHLLTKIFMDRSKPVLLILCRLVAACTASPIPHLSADKWAELALRRYEEVCDTDLLVLYIPLLNTCSHLWWQRGRDKKLITERLNDMSKRGINVSGGPTLTQAIHSLDPRTEII